MFDRIVTHEQAREAFRRLHNALYCHAEKPPLHVPVQPDDVDITLGDYIAQQSRSAHDPSAELVEALREFIKSVDIAEMTAPREVWGKIERLKHLLSRYPEAHR